MMTDDEKGAFVKEFLIKLSPFISGTSSGESGTSSGGNGNKLNSGTDFDLLLEKVMLGVEDKYRLLNYSLILRMMLNIEPSEEVKTLKKMVDCKPLLENLSLLFQESFTVIKDLREGDEGGMIATTHIPIITKLLSLFDKLPLTVGDLLQFRLGKLMKKMASLSNPSLDDYVAQAAFICARWKIMAERIDDGIADKNSTDNVNTINSVNNVTSGVTNNSNSDDIIINNSSSSNEKKRRITKKVTFAAEDDLVKIRIFDVEESDWGAMGHSHHQGALEGGRLMDRNEASNAFRYLAEAMETQTVISKAPPVLDDGFDVWKASKRRSPFALLAEERERSALSVVYFSSEDVPFSPSESFMDFIKGGDSIAEAKQIPVGKVITVKRSLAVKGLSSDANAMNLATMKTTNTTNTTTTTTTTNKDVKSPPLLPPTDILATLQNIIQTQGQKK